jgi:copper homeostasis protein
MNTDAWTDESMAVNELRERVLVEACVDSIESAETALEAGADRLEVCASLIEGGLTPSAGLVAACVGATRLPVHVMIRPRAGDFVYSPAEMEVMRRDIDVAGSLGAAGIVVGVLTAAGHVDVDRTAALIDQARPLSVTFHRAFDVARDFDEALDDVIRAGADRLLSSGGEATALAGTGRLALMVRASSGRIGILAAGGIRQENVGRILEKTGVTEIHARCARIRVGARRHNVAVRFRGGGLPEDSIEVTDGIEMARLVAETHRDRRSG